MLMNLVSFSNQIETLFSVLRQVLNEEEEGEGEEISL